MRIAALCLLLVLAGCASSGAGGPRSSAPRLTDFAGTYEGSFASALSPQPEDDLNFDSCDDRVDTCDTQHDPLVDIALELTARKDGGLDAAFYRSAGDARPMDLLGRGCGTRVGAIEALARDSAQPDQRFTLRYELIIENRLCAGRLRPTSTHHMLVKLFQDSFGDQRAEVLIDKRVTSQNYLYVEEDGVRRRVRIDLDNVPDRRRGAVGYRVCIEDDEGEFSRCVRTDKELKQVVLPVPVPGGVAANYTWWYDLNVNLKRTRGLYELEQYVGRFEKLTR